MGYLSSFNQTWGCWSNLSILVFKERKENKKQEIICSRLAGVLQTPHSSASKELASLHSGVDKESRALRDSLQKQATVSRGLYHFCFGLFTSFEHGWLLPTSNLPIMKASPSEDKVPAHTILPPQHPCYNEREQVALHAGWEQIQWDPVLCELGGAGGLQKSNTSQPREDHTRLYSVLQSQVGVTF